MLAMSREKPILAVHDLSVTIKDGLGVRKAVDGLSLRISRGQTLALFGESGSGKSLTALATLGILPTPPAQVIEGSIDFDGRNLLALSERELQKLRGDRIAMIFQEPNTSLNPLMPVGEQIGETIRLHQRLDRINAREQVLALMEMVGISDPKRRYRSFPHQLSGGIRQRVMIAMALSCRPELLLADEPTSALDTTVQAQIVDLLSRLIRDLGMSVLLITHDLGVVAAMADRVVVIHKGRVVEEGSVREILKDPMHPYTRALLASEPLFNPSSQTHHARSSVADHSSDRNAIGCPFFSLCLNKIDLCLEQNPVLTDLGTGRKVRCPLPVIQHG